MQVFSLKYFLLHVQEIPSASSSVGSCLTVTHFISCILKCEVYMIVKWCFKLDLLQRSDVCDEVNFILLSYINWEGKCHIEDERTKEWRMFYSFSGYALIIRFFEVLHRHVGKRESLWSSDSVLFFSITMMDTPLDLESVQMIVLIG